MRGLILILPWLLQSFIFVQGQECCKIKMVQGMGELDGAYTLKEEVGEKPEDVCVDGCIYSRLNSTNVDDEYCFKREDSSGTLECQAETTGSPDELQNQADNLEAETAALENEVNELESDQNAATALSSELDNVDRKVEELTSGSRVRRQAGTPAAPSVPTTCDEIADMITQMSGNITNLERLNIATAMMQTGVTRCASKTKLLAVKVKIKTVITETGERITKIKIKIKDKKEKIKGNKQKIEIIKAQITIIMRPPVTLPYRPPKTTVGPESGGSGSGPGSGGSGSGPESGGSGSGPGGIDGSSSGEEPVAVSPSGEEPVPITGSGEEPVPIGPGYGGGYGGYGGEEPTEIPSTGEQPVAITGMGEEPTPILGESGEEPVAITAMPGEEPVPIVAGTGEEATPIGGEQGVLMQTTTIPDPKRP